MGDGPEGRDGQIVCAMGEEMREEMAKVCHGGRDDGRDGQVCAVLLHECSLVCT